MKNEELSEVHEHLCDYLKEKYPDASNHDMYRFYLAGMLGIILNEPKEGRPALIEYVNKILKIGTL